MWFLSPAMWSSGGSCRVHFRLDKNTCDNEQGKNLGCFRLHIKSGMLRKMWVRCLQNQAMEQLRSLQRAAVRESSCSCHPLVRTSCHTCSTESSALLSSQSGPPRCGKQKEAGMWFLSKTASRQLPEDSQLAAADVAHLGGMGQQWQLWGNSVSREKAAGIPFPWEGWMGYSWYFSSFLSLSMPSMKSFAGSSLKTVLSSDRAEQASLPAFFWDVPSSLMDQIPHSTGEKRCFRRRNRESCSPWRVLSSWFCWVTGGRGAEEAVPERFIEKWMRFILPADLMLPGVVVPPSGLPQVTRGTLCAVTLLGNRYRAFSIHSLSRN